MDPWSYFGRSRSQRPANQKHPWTRDDATAIVALVEHEVRVEIEATASAETIMTDGRARYDDVVVTTPVPCRICVIPSAARTGSLPACSPDFSNVQVFTTIALAGAGAGDGKRK